MPFIFQANQRNIQSLMRTQQVADDLRARAQRVAAAARDGDAEYRVLSEIGPRRARAAVVTGNFAAHLAEAREHRLARAIDAARGA